ncbi:MAG: DUF554 domain-containing protein [Firmicutes bacterium]|nr:DUF554 domain-containing protein [Bacillota bacterium]
MLGSIVNGIAIVIGSVMGLILKDKFNKPLQDIVTQASGLAVFLLGLNTALTAMQAKDTSPLLYVVSLMIGGIFGQIIDIEARLDKFGNYLEKKFSSSEGGISKGFVNGSLLYCVGSMAILGSFQSGLLGDHTTLFVKSVLDGVISIVFAASMGVGVLLSAVSVFLYEGSLTLLSGLLSPIMTEHVLNEIAVVGGLLIAAIGINILEIKKIRVGNLLPSVLVPIIYCTIFMR